MHRELNITEVRLVGFPDRSEPFGIQPRRKFRTKMCIN